MNIVTTIFERHAGDRPALIHAHGTVSYHELHNRVRAIAATLQADAQWPRGPVPRVALLCPGGPEYIALALAILAAGGCFLPVPEELTASERENLLATTAAELLISSDGNNGMRLCALNSEHSPMFPPEALAALNPAFIRFSSGTTGQAKGIVLSHESLLARITAANAALCIGPSDRVLWMLPMAHHFAVSIVLYLYHGATTILVPPGDAGGLLKPARDHAATVIYGSPYHYAMLAAEPEAAPLPELRLAVSTAFDLPEATARLFEQKFALPLCQGLGIIEAGLPILNLAAPREKPCSIGQPLPSFEVRLAADSGELLIRGPGMLDAYLSPWQTRESILKDGWLATGDIARSDEDGCYFLCGRTRSVINVGGLKCFPEEVEAVLRAHPGVTAARVIARPHPGLGAAPVAEIVPSDHARPPASIELRKHCQQHLATYKVPIGFTFVTELPLTSSGKIKRT